MIRMAKEKILITDLDGTFVKDSIKVIEEDKESIQALKKTMKIGIATGRSIKEINFIENQANIKADVLIGFNGAVVEIDGKRVFEESIQKESLEKVLAYIKEKKIVFDALDGEQRIGTHRSDKKSKLWNMELVEPENLFDSLLNKKIYKINVRPEKGESDRTLLQLQQAFPGLAICKSGEQRIEITPPGITKGNAIEALKEKYDLIVISVGDSENDISMFDVSDHSFCMSHAARSVKERAKTIIDDFHEVNQWVGG